MNDPRENHGAESVQRTEPAEAAEEGYPIADMGRDRVRALVLDAREQLSEDGLTDGRIDDLAQGFLDQGHAPDPEAFISWARRQPRARD